MDVKCPSFRVSASESLKDLSSDTEPEPATAPAGVSLVRAVHVNENPGQCGEGAERPGILTMGSPRHQCKVSVQCCHSSGADSCTRCRAVEKQGPSTLPESVRIPRGYYGGTSAP